MTYLEPSVLLERYATYLLEEVAPAFEDERRRSRVGAVGCALRSLSRELAAEDALERRRRSLDSALADVEAALAAVEADGAATVRERVAGARERVAGADDRAVLLEACEDALAAIDAHLAGASARRARRPLYRFLDRRTAEQCRLAAGVLESA